MYVQFSCEVNEKSKTTIEKLLKMWKYNNPILEKGEWIFEIIKLLSRGHTSAVTFLARFGQPGQERLARVFKVDTFDNMLKEAKAAKWLDSTMSAKFFCRVKNRPENDFWINEDGEKFGIIEFEYAGDMGSVDTVDTLLTFILDEYQKTANENLLKIGEGISSIFDDVIQGLKTKLYKRKKHYNVNGKVIYKRKLKHYNIDLIRKLISEAPPHLKPLFKEKPEEMFKKIDMVLGQQLDTYYTSDYIHGDLNPTNILVYRGYDRAYGTLIDFLEMENKRAEGFTPYFWDFARLEVELILSFFAKGLISTDGIEKTLSKLSISLFEMSPLSQGSKEIITLSNVIVRLRKSFFRTEGLQLDISFDSPETIKSYYFNLLVFYLFIIKFEDSQLEQLVSLAMARLIVDQINKIDSKWVAEKIKDESSDVFEIKSTKTTVLFGSAAILAMVLLIIFLFFNPFKAPLPLNQFKKAKAFVAQQMYKEAIPIFEELIKAFAEQDNPEFYAQLKHAEGRCYYHLAHMENRVNNLKKSLLGYQEALNIFTREKYPAQYARVHNDIGKTFTALALIRKKEDNLKKAFHSFEEALKIITEKKNRVENAKIKVNYAIAIWRLSEVRDKINNLKRSINIFNKSIAILNVAAKQQVAYARALHYLGNAYSEAGTEAGLKQAIKSYHKALKIRTLEKYATEYALTQNSLGRAYWKYSYIKDTNNNLHKAIRGYKNALKIKTYKKYPFYHAMAQINLGLAYKDLAFIATSHEEKEKNLDLAIITYGELLEVYSVDEYPLYYTMAQINLAAIYLALYDTMSKDNDQNIKKLLDKAIIAYNEALIIGTYDEYPDYYGIVQENLGIAYTGLAQFENEKTNLQLSIEAYTNSLNVFSLEEYPFDHATIQTSLGNTYVKLANIEAKNKNRKAAKKAFTEALKVWNAKEFPDHYNAIQKTLKHIAAEQ